MKPLSGGGAYLDREGSACIAVGLAIFAVTIGILALVGHEAAVQRTALGMDALESVVVTHPLSTLTAEQLDARAREAAPQVRAVWEGSPVPRRA